MKLFINGALRAGTLAEKWVLALHGLDIRHADPAVEVEIHLQVDDDPPVLKLQVRGVADTATGLRKEHMVISNVRLNVWPGAELCRMWLAAAWAGYLQHEALELVTYRAQGEVGTDTARTHPLDPHEQPYEVNPFNRGVRDGLPPVLTGETLIVALATCMDMVSAVNLVRVYSNREHEACTEDTDPHAAPTWPGDEVS